MSFSHQGEVRLVPHRGHEMTFSYGAPDETVLRGGGLHTKAKIWV